MGFVIPSSDNKLYLSGADWIISTLDCMMRASTCAGNSSQIVVRIDALIDEKTLREKLTAFVCAFPVLGGVISRDMNLTPYWRIPEGPAAGPDLSVYYLEEKASKSELISFLEKSINRPFSKLNQHLAFHLFQIGKVRSVFAMTFDHSLFDARGAEVFLDLFISYAAGTDISGVLRNLKLTARADLSEWMTKFYSGRNVNRKMIALSRPPFGTLPLPLDKDKGFRLRVIYFDETDTKAIYEKALSKAGYLMEMPYLLAVVLQRVNLLFKRKGIDADNFMVPVTIDTRQSKDRYHEIFMNHVSYLFFKVNAVITSNMQETIKSLKQQMFEQVKSGLPRDLSNASALMRIFPRSLLSKIMYLPFGGQVGSVVFAYLGESRLRSFEFLGEKIVDHFHTPRVTTPPGLGFFFSLFNGRLNMVITYLDGLLTEEDVLSLEHGIVESLKIA